MEKKIILILCLIAMGWISYSQKAVKTHFNTKEEIVSWVNKEQGSSFGDTIEISIYKHSLFIVIKDYGFGMSRMGVSIFLKKELGWQLVCFHNTNSNTAKIEIDSANHLLFVKSIGGTNLLIVPLDGIGVSK